MLGSVQSLAELRRPSALAMATLDGFGLVRDGMEIGKRENCDKGARSLKLPTGSHQQSRLAGNTPSAPQANPHAPRPRPSTKNKGAVRVRRSATHGVERKEDLEPGGERVFVLSPNHVVVVHGGDGEPVVLAKRNHLGSFGKQNYVYQQSGRTGRVRREIACVWLGGGQWQGGRQPRNERSTREAAEGGTATTSIPRHTTTESFSPSPTPSPPSSCYTSATLLSPPFFRRTLGHQPEAGFVGKDEHALSAKHKVPPLELVAQVA